MHSSPASLVHLDRLKHPSFNPILFQILNLAHNRSELERRVHAVIDKFAERGLRSLAVAYQVTHCRNLDAIWMMTGLLLFT